LAPEQAARSLKPNGVVVEVSSPHLDGVDAAELLEHKLPSPELKFLIARSAVHTAAKTAPQIAPQTFAFQKYHMREQSRDHHQRRIASVRHERQYGANA
jgi:hypothetical protein